MRARISMLSLTLALLLATAGAVAADEPYIIVLRDGTFVRATEAPVLVAGSARLRLHPSGLLAMLPQGSIDLPATELANPDPHPERAPDAERPAPPTGTGTFTWGGDSSTPPPQPPPPPDPFELSPAEKHEISEAFSRRNAQLLRLEKDLQEDVHEARAERDRYDRDLRLYFSVPRLRQALAYELSHAAEELEYLEETLERVQRDIRDLHLEAVDRGLHIRQLSYPMLD